MIVYDNEKKSLVIPNGLGNITSVIDDGKYEEGYEKGRETQKIIDDSNLTEVTLRDNGEFDAEYGYKKVTVNVDVETPYNDGYKEGYDEGYEKGESDGRTDGFEKGFTKGKAVQKSKLIGATVTENITITREDGFNEVIVNVPDNYEKGKEDGAAEQKAKLTKGRFTENGIYETEDGYSEVTVNIDTQGYYNDGYNAGMAKGLNDGYNNGVEAQKSKLTSITIDTKGTYTREDGYKEVIVNIESDPEELKAKYEEGKADGIAEQKGKMTTLNITGNGTFSREDGYRSVTVDVETDPQELQKKYNEGKEAGIAEQKSKLSSINVSANGTISREDGYKTVNINVPSDPAELQAKYDEGKAAGITQQKAKLETLTISNNGTYEKEDGYKKVVVSVSETGKVEDVKSVGLSNTTLEVTPSAGFDAMAKVNINASVLANNKYNEGVAAAKANMGETIIEANGTYTNENGWKKIIVNTPAQPEIQNKKNVTVNSNTQNVSPDSGYSAMASVAIDATAFGNTRYNEGKAAGSAEGYAQGVADQKAKLETITITSNGTYTKGDGYKEIIVDVQGGYVPEKLTIAVSATDHIDDLIGKDVVNVIYDGENHIYSYNGEDIVIDVKVGVRYMVQYLNVSGFTAPASPTDSFISMWDGRRMLLCEYEYQAQSKSFVKFEINDTDYDGVYLVTTNKIDNLKYSYDGEAWNDWEDTTIAVPFADKVIYLCGNNPTGFNNQITFKVDKSQYRHIKFNVSGNIMALINADNPPMEITQSGAFYEAFKNTYVVNVSQNFLPATTLSDECYQNMFQGCRYLVNAPALPATTVKSKSYYYMFQGCTSLVNAPALPATTLNKQCYNSMFQGCSSLVNTPALPATTLADLCYQFMFKDCSSLVDAPELPATTLADYCYSSMFYGCTSLVNAPELPAETLTLTCYNSMFQGCTSLVNAPELPAETLTTNCYANMFKECANINNIVCKARTNINTTNLKDWLTSASKFGKFYKYADSSFTRSTSGIPTDWTVYDI